MVARGHQLRVNVPAVALLDVLGRNVLDRELFVRMQREEAHDQTGEAVGVRPVRHPVLRCLLMGLNTSRISP